MRKLEITQLHLNDVVLVEFFCYRWRRPWIRANPGWTTWFTSFRLDAVSLLVRAPRTERPAPSDTFTGTL